MNTKNNKYKLAIVYDRVVKFGGAERILLALHEIWPQAPLYTAVYRPQKASWARNFRINQSFLKYFPFPQAFQEILPFLTPYAFESFSFDEFDVVLSVTSQDAKAIITKPSTRHICYCLTPTRYLWSGYREYYRQPGLGFVNPLARLIMRLFFPPLRRWDTISSKRPDNYLAISQTVKKRIAAYYKRDSDIIYPPVNTTTFHPPKRKQPGKFYLIVTRLVPYKRVDYAISAFNRLGLKLKIIGSGSDKSRLKKMAGPNIEFIDGNLTDQKLCWYYQNCLALIFPGVEDFGLTPLEAQACGRPVIALGVGGTKESVIEGKTGVFYRQKTAGALIKILKEFSGARYKASDCRQNSLRFSKPVFKEKMRKKVDSLMSGKHL